MRLYFIGGLKLHVLKCMITGIVKMLTVILLLMLYNTLVAKKNLCLVCAVQGSQ